MNGTPNGRIESAGDEVGHGVAAIPGGPSVGWHEAGAGFPVVLLHGIGSCADSWRPVMRLLAGRYRAIAWDMPGYGASEPIEEPRPDARAYVETLEALLDALDVGRAHFVGHSLGALVAAGVAAFVAERVVSLTLVSPALGAATPSERAMPRDIRRRIEELEAIGPEAFAKRRAPNLCGKTASADSVRAIERAMAQVRMPGYGQACWLLAQGDLVTMLNGVEAPGLVVGCLQDKVVPASRARALAAGWPSCHYRELENVGHAGYLEDPHAYVGPIRDFIDNISERA